MNRRVNVVSLLIGLAFVSLAVLVLHQVYGGTFWSTSKVTAPIILVAIGVIGIALSQQRNSPKR